VVDGSMNTNPVIIDLTHFFGTEFGTGIAVVAILWLTIDIWKKVK
jgi:hypothetical protein